MQILYFNRKRSFGSLFVLAGLAALIASSAASAYDLGDENRSGGQGFGLNGMGTGNQNRSFKDFTNFTPDENFRSKDSSNPADLFPVTHSNTVTDSNNQQLQITDPSHFSSNVVSSGSDMRTSGTSFNQAPNSGQMSPYPGAKGSLPPVNTALQAMHMPTALTPVTSGAYSFGFAPLQLPLPQYSGIYRGSNVPQVYGANPFSNTLPPCSSGSIDFNITTK